MLADHTASWHCSLTERYSKSIIDRICRQKCPARLNVGAGAKNCYDSHVLPRIALKIEYSGKKFCGSQFQVGVRTVQAELEKAVGTYFRSEQRVKVIFSGRTDAGVHARGQIVHFDLAEGNFDLWRLCWALNGIVGDDLSITAAQIVPDDFHSRFSAIRRSYVYRMLNRSQRSALLKDTHHFVPFELDLNKMQSAAAVLAGSHDFAAFKSSNSDTSTTRCHVESAHFLNLGEGKLEFCISANHFVYNMVRIIVGTLIEIGLGKRPMTDLGEALSERQRRKAGPTAPPWGLCLESVEYPAAYELFKSASFQGRELISNQEIIKP
jgi:tRNA pseudouridine38-40 synthase